MSTKRTFLFVCSVSIVLRTLQKRSVNKCEGVWTSIALTLKSLANLLPSWPPPPLFFLVTSCPFIYFCIWLFCCWLCAPSCAGLRDGGVLKCSRVHRPLSPSVCKVAGHRPACTVCSQRLRSTPCLVGHRAAALSGFRGLNLPIKQYSVDNKNWKNKTWIKLIMNLIFLRWRFVPWRFCLRAFLFLRMLGEFYVFMCVCVCVCIEISHHFFQYMCTHAHVGLSLSHTHTHTLTHTHAYTCTVNIIKPSQHKFVF